MDFPLIDFIDFLIPDMLILRLLILSITKLTFQYRPSQWSWRRGEARYTAATIHMWWMSVEIQSQSMRNCRVNFLLM